MKKPIHPIVYAATSSFADNLYPPKTLDCVERGENGSLGNSAFVVPGYVVGQYDGDAWLEKG
jgi:hypothetical protein